MISRRVDIANEEQQKVKHLSGSSHASSSSSGTNKDTTKRVSFSKDVLVKNDFDDSTKDRHSAKKLSDDKG
jgi:hypothetical protein